jgi:hypothetical protein
VLGAFAELVSAAGQPGQECGHYGAALLRPLVGVIAQRLLARNVFSAERNWAENGSG